MQTNTTEGQGSTVRLKLTVGILKGKGNGTRGIHRRAVEAARTTSSFVKVQGTSVWTGETAIREA